MTTFSKSNSSSTPDKAQKQYAQGRRDYRAGFRFNRLSNKSWQRGYVDARKEDEHSRSRAGVVSAGSDGAGSDRFGA